MGFLSNITMVFLKGIMYVGKIVKNRQKSQETQDSVWCFEDNKVYYEKMHLTLLRRLLGRQEQRAGH